MITVCRSSIGKSQCKEDVPDLRRLLFEEEDDDHEEGSIIVNKKTVDISTREFCFFSLYYHSKFNSVYFGRKENVDTTKKTSFLL
jgi:hypothetical protein